MQTRTHNTFTSIHTEGSLLPVDLLQRVLTGDKDLGGLTPADYHLPENEKLNEAINRSWNRLQGAWAVFQTSKSRLGESDPGTTLTRERWLLPLFQELGYGRLVTTKAIEIEGKAYPISHGWANVPIHLVGCGVDLDHRAAGVAGASKSSPHSLVQELLNQADDRQWGIVANGLRLRILRDNVSLTRQAYLEFDLEAMFAGEVYSDFVLLWLLCHQSRFESGDGKIESCWLEKWSKVAQERGTRALDQLRTGVEEAISVLGSGFLSHPSNQDLRKKLHSGELNAQDYYRQLLRLVYRLIFLFAAEDRDLLLDPQADTTACDRYLRYYSTARLRRLAERQRGGRHSDLWQGLKLVTDILAGKPSPLAPDQKTIGTSPLPSLGEGKGQGVGVRALGLPVLNGFLFSDKALPDLEASQVDNQSLLNAIRSLAFTVEGNSRRAVDYKNLGPEELGSVYESLLELHPILNSDAGTFELTSASGHERKTTGSYYTPTSLIQVLLDSALNPVIEQTLDFRDAKIDDSKGESRTSILESRLLALKVCDPACGSGHFLIAAAHRIARRLAEVRAGDNEPSPNETRRALRDVIRHCIYGVDINPMAVELCKVNLWLESLEPGKPLSFLDAHIQCGDSLVGVGPGLDISEIPDEAFNPAFDDDKATAAALKKRNKRERSGQLGFRWKVTEIKTAEDLAQWRAEHAEQVDAMPEDEPAQVQAKAQAYSEFQGTQQYIQNRLEYDLWTAAFFWPIQKGDAEHMLAPTQQELVMLHAGGKTDVRLVEKVQRMANHLNFFHWELAFPQVFSGKNPGFDCVLGNPPWERIKLQEEEFFASRDPEIAAAPNKAARQKLIETLIHFNIALAHSFEEAKHAAEATSKFVRISQRFLLTAVGDMNTYALFAELVKGLLLNNGRAGIIVPTGIATDDTTKDFFGDLTKINSIASLFDFENREAIFPGVHRSYKFCLLTLSNKAVDKSDFTFFCARPEHIKDSRRRFSLAASEISLFNPNTLTMPIFRTRSDAELTRNLYKSVPILGKEGENNLWDIYFTTMFHSSSDAHFFIDADELINSGFTLGSRGEYTKRNEIALPVYEGKMFMQFDHRAATVVQSESALVRKRQSENSTLAEHQNLDYITHPQYWALRKNIPEKQRWNWIACFKKVTSPTNERTLISTILPPCATNDSIHLIMNAGDHSPELIVALLSNLNSLVTDYICRQKLGGVNLNFYVVKQLPILPPSAYTPANIHFIAPRVLELVYTAYDLKPFADDMGYNGEPFRWDEDRRALLRGELDAYYARLYGLNHKQLRYILDPADLTPKELEDILDPWEEVSDALNQEGYERRRNTSDFPGETFRVLKEKEIKQFGEYRTRRLVLEAWERLEGLEIGNPEGYRTQEMENTPQREVITLNSAKAESQPAVAEKASEEQPTLTDFGLYKCEVCGKMVMGFEKEEHVREKHGGKGVEWKKVK